MDCLFCKIANKEISSVIIYEDSFALAFLDVHPRSAGHALIVPKSHAANILELPDDSTGPLFNAVKKVAGMIERGLNPAGFTIGINHGSISGQTVEHLHIHVIPRYEDDGGGSIHSVVNFPPKETLEEIAKKVTQ